MTATSLAGARVVVAVTAPRSAGFYEGQLAALRAAGAEVYFLSSPSEEVAAQCANEGARYLAVAMERAPAPWRDLRSLAEVTRTLARVRPDLVNAGTPKAGLLGMLAAAALRVPVRVHTVHGLRYEAAHGAVREALWLAQRTSCALATEVVCVSPSLRARAIETGALARGRGRVIGDGSINGVDLEHFRADASARAQFRARHGLAPDDAVVGYLGRLAGDKGVADLAAAWRLLDAPGRRLVIAGELDDTDPPPAAALAELRARATLLGHVDAAAFYAGVDVVVLPTLREGFPSVALEAAAASRPVVATRATGCVDAIVDGETGALVPIGAPAPLADALRRYLDDASLRARHGAAARARAEACFSRTRVHQLTVELYRSLLGP